MASPPAISYDTYYHIYNRGINRENIFIEEKNYAYFLDLTAVHLAPAADLLAFCLLRNHFHFLVRIKSKEEIDNFITTNDWKDALRPARIVPSQCFSNLFNAYAKSINKAYNRTGGLFQNPFGRVPIQADSHMWNVIAYIHQNPQKHQFVSDFRDWPYSSYGLTLSDRPAFLQREIVLEWFGGSQQYLDLHHQWITTEAGNYFAQNDDN